jgi:hypothetical protein
VKIDELKSRKQNRENNVNTNKEDRMRGEKQKQILQK